MSQGQFRFPFMNIRPLMDHNQGFLKTIQTFVFPHFQPLSMSSVLILANIIIFILIHILFSPSSYTNFLNWPYQMDKWLLQIQMVKTNKMYMYQAFTALFMHENYLHIMGNTIFALFVMYQMEYSWRWSIPMGVFAGFVANCLAVLTLQGRLLGFSGVLCSYVGMIVILLITHINYIQQRYPGTMCMLIVTIVVLTISVIGIGNSILIHLYGYVLGMLLGLGWYPKAVPFWNAQPCKNILRIGSLAVCVLIIVLAFVH